MGYQTVETLETNPVDRLVKEINQGSRSVGDLFNECGILGVGKVEPQILVPFLETQFVLDHGPLLQAQLLFEVGLFEPESFENINPRDKIIPYLSLIQNAIEDNPIPLGIDPEEYFSNIENLFAGCDTTEAIEPLLVAITSTWHTSGGEIIQQQPIGTITKEKQMVGTDPVPTDSNEITRSTIMYTQQVGFAQRGLLYPIAEGANRALNSILKTPAITLPEYDRIEAAIFNYEERKKTTTEEIVVVDKPRLTTRIDTYPEPGD